MNPVQFGQIINITSDRGNSASVHAAYRAFTELRAAENALVLGTISQTTPLLSSSKPQARAVILDRADASNFLMERYAIDPMLLPANQPLRLADVVTLAQVDKGVKRFLDDTLEFVRDNTQNDVQSGLFAYVSGKLTSANPVDASGRPIINIVV